MASLYCGIFDESQDLSDECILFHIEGIDEAQFLYECEDGEQDHIFG
jgi:hypothetical protein